VQSVELTKIAAELGYTSPWLDWGFVDEPYLRAQYAQYTSTDDKNQEHYRCGAFREFLRRHSRLSDEVVDRIFRLADDGPDRCNLHQNRIFELLLSGRLSDEQHFALAKRQPTVLEPPLQKIYWRCGILRKIRQSGVAANFAEIQLVSDREVQLELLEHADLAREHLVWLAERGANKAIRNRAAQRLQRNQFRQR
jgi:hypothetical protein